MTVDADCPACQHPVRWHPEAAPCHKKNTECLCVVKEAGAAPIKCAETTLDSGHRKTFVTGSQRDAPEGKGAYHLISPLALRRLALVLERGAAKYAPRNWEKGQPLSQYMNSAMRHICQFIEGRRDEDHLAQALWNLHAAVHTEEQIAVGKLPAELHDLPNYLGERKT